MAVADFHLKIDGIEGESQHAKHKNEIQIESFSFGETQSGTFREGGGGGAGKVAMQDFHFTMKLSKASPKLALACATGEHIGKAVLTCRKAGKEQEEFYKVTMSDLLVSSYQTSGHGEANFYPTDQVSLNFAKVEWEYKEQTPKGGTSGSVKAGYNLKEAKAV
jgi:type VI secretion system secreted protein Hcp